MVTPWQTVDNTNCFLANQTPLGSSKVCQIATDPKLWYTIKHRLTHSSAL